MTEASSTHAHVVLVDGTIIPVSEGRPADFVHWERYARSAGIRNPETPSLEMALYMIYRDHFRSAESKPSFDAWIDEVAEVNLDEDPPTVEPKPTATAPSPD